MQNAEVARMFDDYADILEIQAANPFRVRAYRNAARVLGDLADHEVCPVVTQVGRISSIRRLDRR